MDADHARHADGDAGARRGFGLMGGRGGGHVLDQGGDVGLVDKVLNLPVVE